MFGSSKPFGTASTFGANTFGNTTASFGQTTGNVFGGGTPFGMSATAAPMAGGMFGANPPTTSTGLFGQPAASFGTQPATSAAGFGFGGTSTSGGLFGGTTPSTQSSGGLFGNTNNSAFGAPRVGFGGAGFGATSTANTGLFGQQTNTGTATLFGSTAGFGAAAAPPGTTIKFNPPSGTDTMMKAGVSQSIATRHQCITCMKEYENKSLEELRLEDYAANRKGGGATTAGFGAPAQQTTGLFGNNTAASSSAFNFGGATTQAKPLFGTSGTTNAFGTTTGGLFGQPAPNQNAGLFGKPAVGGFGTPASTAPSAFNFGGTTTPSLFGQTNQPKPLFGQTTGTTGLFGNTATTQASAFGTGTTAFGNFGATAQQPTSLFGNKPTAFGAPSTATTNSFSFGTTNTLGGGGLFGQKTAAPAFGTATAFGGQPSSFGSFGTTPAAGTGLFGQTKPATSAFGTTGGSMFSGGLGSSFGTPAFSSGLGTNTGTGLFGATTANKNPGFSFGNTPSTGFNFSAPNPGSSSFSFGTPSAAVTGDPNAAAAMQQNHQQMLALSYSPYGDSPLFRNPLKEVSKEAEVLKPTNPSAQKALLNDNPYKVVLIPTAKIKPKAWSPAASGKMLLFDGLEDEEPGLGTAAFLPKKSVKKLVLKNLNTGLSSLTFTSDASPSQTTRIDLSISLNKPTEDIPQNVTTSSPDGVLSSPLTFDVTYSSANSNDRRQSEASSPVYQISDPLPPSSASPFENRFNTSLNDSIAALHTNKAGAASKTYKVHTLREEPNSSSGDIFAPEASTSSDSQHPTGIILTKPSYYTRPPLDEMISCVVDGQKCLVNDFCVGREGYGEVQFPGITNVANLNLDEIVLFGKKEINVYPNDENKPPIGEGLNRNARVVLRNVWPSDKTDHSLIKDPERIARMGYREKIERCTKQIGAKFIDYIAESGSWIFEVDHFSKYGLEDSDDEMEVQPSHKLPLKSSVSSSKVQPEQQVKQNVMSSNILQSLGHKPMSPFPSGDQDMDLYGSLDFIEDDMFCEVTSPRHILNPEIDAERIHGMKASFFHEGRDEEQWGFPMYQEKQNAFFSQNLNDSVFLPNKPFDVLKKPRFLEPEVPSPVTAKQTNSCIQNSMSALAISPPKLPSWYSELPLVKGLPSKTQLTPKTLPGALNKIVLRPIEKSHVFKKEHMIADAGYFMGRSFRVGWRPDGAFVHALTANNEAKEGYESHPFLFSAPKMAAKMINAKSCFKVRIESTACKENYVEPGIIEALKLQLDSSESTFENDTPLFVPCPGVELVHLHAALFENSLKSEASKTSDTDFIRQCVFVWDLLVSLWGKVRGLNNESSYATQMARREALSQWLIKSTDRDISKAIESEKDYLVKIFFFLNGRHPADAIKLAQKNFDFRLSLLLSQSESGSAVRNLIGKQISNWKENGAYEFIKPSRITLYALLSGNLVADNINCCKGLRWKQVLALLLWYHCNCNGSIQEVMDEYDQAFQGLGPNGKYAIPPFPPYIDDIDIYAMMETDGPDTIYDTCYHLLKLYCDRSHRLDVLLMPETYSYDHLDYRMSWLLHLALSSIGYNIPAEVANTLSVNFASQLEASGHWEWAVFVLLHMTDMDTRRQLVKDILLRSVSLEQTDNNKAKEDFLINNLNIPEIWIYEAKAVKASAFGNKVDEAWYLLKAEAWSKSHSIVIKHLVSDAVINEDYDFLLKYLLELAIPERCCTILDWSSGGQVYLDYINMCKVLDSIVSQELDAYVLEKFRPKVVNLCERLSSIPMITLKDRLSVAEMARKTATTLRSISILQATRTKDSQLLTSLASCIKNLPMPHDYAVSDYRFVAHCFLEAAAE